MNRRTLCKIAILGLFGAAAYGEVIDRIVAVVDNTFIITASDVRKERAVQTAMGNTTGDDNALIDALVEKHLIEEQIAQFREIEVDAEAIVERLKELQNPLPPGVSSDDLRSAVVGELRRYQFFVQRFGQFIRVSDEELRRYFDEVYVPDLQRRGMPIPPVEKGMAEVRPYVVAEKMNQEADAWLAELRRRSPVEKILQ